MVTTPKQKDLSHIGKMEAAFENGYDSDGEDQPYTGVWIKEGDQLFEEEAVPPWVAAAAAIDIANAITTQTRTAARTAAAAAATGSPQP